MDFEFTTAPRIIFGAGALDRLGALSSALGSSALVIVGGHSAQEAGVLERLQRELSVSGVIECDHEPTIEDVDRAVERGREAGCDHIVALGGGSAMDLGKACAGMITNGGALGDYLEGIGAGREIELPAMPLIAVPTTAGTGSEVTKNAVISGPGYKKSLRSPLLIPRVALVDPELTCSLPPEQTAACGMDALTQLIESYLSRGATPITDALALQGIEAVASALLRAFQDPEDAHAREQMALGSLLSGICLANAGLGAVHGIAASLGAVYPISHGNACAALLPQVMQANVLTSQDTIHQGRVWLRFAQVAEALSAERSQDMAAAGVAGVASLDHLQHALRIPGLAALDVVEEDLERIVAGSRGSSMRFNPVEFTDAQLLAILKSAMRS